MVTFKPHIMIKANHYFLRGSNQSVHLKVHQAHSLQDTVQPGCETQGKGENQDGSKPRKRRGSSMHPGCSRHSDKMQGFICGRRETQSLSGAMCRAGSRKHRQVVHIRTQTVSGESRGSRFLPSLSIVGASQKHTSLVHIANLL